MTTQPAQPEAPQPAAMVERVSRLEGITEQINLRLAENTEAINTLRAENRAGHESLRAEFRTEHESLRAENRAGHESLRAEFRAEHESLNAKIDRLRAEMHRQTLLVIGILGGLMALLRFVG